MTHLRQAPAVLGGILLAVTWTSASSASSASSAHVAQHGVVIDSTHYQSEQQLLGNTQVMVVAEVESARVDRSAPASQPGSLVTVKVHDVLRGRVGNQIVVEQPRGTNMPAGRVVQAPLRTGRTYLLLLARAPGTSSYYLVGGNAGEFTYDKTTQRFTRVDASATWENSDFALSLAKIGAETFPASTQPSWLTNPNSPSGSHAVAWSSMANDLGLSPTDVACPSQNLCLFAGEVSPPSPGVVIPAVAVSTGPFTPHAGVVGTTTTFPPSSNSSSWSFVACAGADLCVVSTADGVYVTTDPTAAHWVLAVAPSSDSSFGQVSCPTVSFCAVATGSGVLVSGSPSSSSSAWSDIRVGNVGQAISCPSPRLCVTGGFDDTGVGGWIATSTDPLVAGSWHSGPTTHPSFAQHSGQYGVTGISCPTTAFCVAADEAGEPLVSTDPAGGVGTWTEAANGITDDPGLAACTTAGQCSVSGVGSFQARGGAPGPGITGYPLPGVSCVSPAFCVTVTDEQLAVGKGSG